MLNTSSDGQLGEGFGTCIFCLWAHRLTSSKSRGDRTAFACRDDDDFGAFLVEHGTEQAESNEPGEEAQAEEAQSEGGEEDEVHDDEALARRLFIDEQLAHQQRLLALAGKQKAWQGSENLDLSAHLIV